MMIHGKSQITVNIRELTQGNDHYIIGKQYQTISFQNSPFWTRCRLYLSLRQTGTQSVS